MKVGGKGFPKASDDGSGAHVRRKELILYCQVVSWKTKESVASVIDKHNMANHANIVNAVEYVRNADPEQFAHIRDEKPGTEQPY
ncbi:hypothetical protein G5I_13941 [Acromyrmex echinatior]|uniref:Uncharacterized protein n=1 Tax=Acromyrmex echinatior TaxID=103372 RepID=F4X6C6_ACREC|nr:hypothetical protein G5I_13941 [Acromyrmex echinatior]